MEQGGELDMLEPLKRGPDELKRIIKRVLELESERLYQEKPHLNDDVLRIVREEIK